MEYSKHKYWSVNLSSLPTAVSQFILLLAFLPSNSHALGVDEYGAVGDGVTWDHNAIQDAVDAAGDGGVVEFTAGKIYVACGQVNIPSNQTIQGNGATLKRCNAPTTTLLQAATAGSTTLLVGDPGVFEPNQFITPVKGDGSLSDGEYLTMARFQSSDGQEVTISQPLSQDYPAGVPVTGIFNQMVLRTGVSGVTIDSLTFDGNRDNNQTYLGWTVNNALVTRTGLTVVNSIFKNTPGNAITAFGTDVLITNNSFTNLDGPIVHLSGNTPTDDTYVTISENIVSDTNFQSARMGHSEGVITISKFNNSIKVLDNTVQRADVPFIALIHDEMGGWLIEGNNVIDTNGIFSGNLREGWPPLINMDFKNNQFTNVGASQITRSSGASQIQNFRFTDNNVSGGSLAIDGLLDSTIMNNTILSCNTPPIILTEDTNVVVTGNITASDYCGDSPTTGTDGEDSDGDGIDDSVDQFPNDVDNDIDGDTISGPIDNCPTVSNTDQSDVGSDGIGDVCDTNEVDNTITSSGSGKFNIADFAIIFGSFFLALVTRRFAKTATNPVHK